MAKSIKRILLSFPGFDEDDEDDLPCEFRIFSFGDTDTTKGKYSMDMESAKSVMAAAADYGNRLTMDYEHAALSDPPTPAPAAASYMLELRADGIYAIDVKWSDKAAQMLRAKEYFYFSPAFEADKKGRPMRLLNIALTNIPATKRMQSLVAANQLQESRMLTVLSALSLKEDASEAQALVAVSQLSEDRINLLKSVGKESVAEAMGVITALKAKADQADALQIKLTAIEAEKDAAETVALLDEATRDGRLTPANRKEVEKLNGEFGLKALRAFLSVMPKAAAPAIEAPVAEAIAPVIADSAIEKMLKTIGVNSKDIVTHKAKMRNIAAIEKEEA